MKKLLNIFKCKKCWKRFAVILLAYVTSYNFMRQHMYTWPGQPDYPQELIQCGERPVIAIQYYCNIDWINRCFYYVYWPAGVIDATFSPKFIMSKVYWDSEYSQSFDNWALKTYVLSEEPEGF